MFFNIPNSHKYLIFLLRSAIPKSEFSETHPIINHSKPLKYRTLAKSTILNFNSRSLVQNLITFTITFFGNITLNGATPTPTLHSQYSWQQVNTSTEILTCQMIIYGDSSIYSLHLDLRLWVDIRVIKHGGRGAILQE